MTTATSELSPTAAARLLASYAKHFGAGAFATPLAKDLHPGDLWTWTEGTQASVAVVKHFDRPSTRTDWTGRRYTLPAMSRVVTHLGRTPNGPIPAALDMADFIFAYIEDAPLTASLRSWGREVVATRISAASELIACWGREGQGHLENAADSVTARTVDIHPIPDAVRSKALAELADVDAWHDDYPFYSDGTWSAVSLRGFNPADPLWGVKPSEMPRKWRETHPEALGWRCGWTVLADRCPTLRALVDDVRWITGLERVRLMRMQGIPGRDGHLARHSDVTDRNAGTRNGAIARFHLPLVTDPRIKMSTWDLAGVRRDVHLEPWCLWYLDARKPHAVTNPTGTDRIHLVIDAIVDPAVRSRIEAP